MLSGIAVIMYHTPEVCHHSRTTEGFVRELAASLTKAISEFLSRPGSVGLPSDGIEVLPVEIVDSMELKYDLYLNARIIGAEPYGLRNEDLTMVIADHVRGLGCPCRIWTEYVVGITANVF